MTDRELMQQALDAQSRGTKMVMQVHDELVFEVQKESIESCKSAVRQLMEHTVTLSVPLIVSIGIGSDWDAAHFRSCGPRLGRFASAKHASGRYKCTKK